MKQLIRSIVLTLFFVILSATAMAAGPAPTLQTLREVSADPSVDPAASYLKELLSGPRFMRDPQGIITDRLTGLQWLEGPDQSSSWEMAQAWIAGLGRDWRTPTLEELAALYIADSNRRGTFGDPLCIDPVFTRESGYCLWSVERYDGTAWIYDFSRGYAHWIDTVFPGRFDRAVAVRNP